METNVSTMFSKPFSKEFPPYQHYFEPKAKEKGKKHEKENMKNLSKVGR